MKEFRTSDGVEYAVDHHGIVNQVDPKPFIYDEKYVSTYDSPEYKKASKILNSLRSSLITSLLARSPLSVLDFGYGNGDFLRQFKEDNIWAKLYGYDISGCDTPEGVDKVDNLVRAEVYTFWDSLEHCKDLEFVRNLDCNYVFISLPFWHEGDDWFNNWKHRKPNEHLHHFNKESLKNFFEDMGYKLVGFTDIEDFIRKPVDHRQNILTGVFKKRTYPF